MAKPIYAGSYTHRRGGKWKTVFIIVLLIQVAVVAYFVWPKDKGGATDSGEMAEPTAPDFMEPAPLDLGPSPIVEVEASPAVKALISDAQSAIDAGQLLDAQSTLDRIVADTPDAEAIKLLGEVNIQLLTTPIMMPGKSYYAIQSGDYLQKIAKNHNTTVPLIKKMNGMETDTIRAGARLMVYNGDLSVRVSKSQNTLDLMAGDKLFKRYSVGTGKFGKTPAVEFKIVDKIIEPPWTRPSDNKQIEYGDKENVLGTRWMKIVSDDHPEITGFGIHGTWERDSIGQQSSAGCVRMLNEDVEELFDLVPRKTIVIITE